MRRLLIITGAIVLVGAAVFGYRQVSDHSSTAFRTIPVKRGDLTVTISATGTVEPEEVVDVGAQVAGKINSFGPDPGKPGKIIDYGSEVDVGTVLARIDDSLYSAEVASTTAQLEQAKANVPRSKADLDSKIAAVAQAQAGVDLALVTVNHLKAIPEDSASNIELETADATLKQAQAAEATAKANVAVSEATLVESQSAVHQAEANLSRAKTNLDYCTIKSPVKGVIVDRRVNIGQTVVSSLNAPSLFLIAKDLKRMQVWASVNEADIGNIHPGQIARFTVDAYPGHTFEGKVGKIRLNATMTQNVVTYTVEITTDNSDGKLLPYLTANVLFEVTNLKNVLLVPNVALRWIPPPQLIAPDAKQSTPRERRSANQSTAPATSQRSKDDVWIPDGKYARPVTVRAGMSDGSQSQVQGDQIHEGTEVIIGEAPVGETTETTTNPFAPQIFGGRRQQ